MSRTPPVGYPTPFAALLDGSTEQIHPLHAVYRLDELPAGWMWRNSMSLIWHHVTERAPLNTLVEGCAPTSIAMGRVWVTKAFVAQVAATGHVPLDTDRVVELIEACALVTEVPGHDEGMARVASASGLVELRLPVDRIAEYATVEIPGDGALPEIDHTDPLVAAGCRWAVTH